MAGLNVRHVHSKDLREETTSLLLVSTMASHIPGGSLNLVLIIYLLFCVFGKKCSLRSSLQALSFEIKTSFINKKWGCIYGLQLLLNKFLQFLSRLRDIFVRTQCATFSIFGKKNAHFEAVCKLCCSKLRLLSLIKNGAAFMGYNFC